MKENKSYAQARDQFSDGDIVFFSGGSKNIVRRMITWFTRGPHYHVGLAFWVLPLHKEQPRLMLAESQPDGFRIINLGAYANRNMTVYKCPVAWSDIADVVFESAGVTPYSLSELAMVGLHERFGVDIPDNMSGAGSVCSAIVSKFLQLGGMKGIDTVVSPQRLFEQLGKTQPIKLSIVK